MAMVKKSITVTDKQEAWIQSEIAAGNYGTDSELIREALREKKTAPLNLKPSAPRSSRARTAGSATGRWKKLENQFKKD
jgi:antitoxin ParD1/3/4